MPAVMLSLIAVSFGAVFIYAISEVGVLKGLLLVIVVPVVGLLVPGAVRKTIRLISNLRPNLRWWHGLWLLLYLSALLFRVRTDTDIQESLLDPWAVYRVVSVGVTAAVLAGRLLFQKTAWFGSILRGSVGAMAAYCCLCLASTLWSTHPAWTLYKSVEFFVDVALTAAILVAVPSVRAYKSLFDWTYLLFALQLTSVWVGAAISPAHALLPASGLLPVQLYGIIPAEHANGVGQIGAVLAIVAVSRLLSNPYKRHSSALLYGLLGMGAATMILAQTRSAIIGFLVGLVLVLYFSKRLGMIAVLGIAALLLASLTGWGTFVNEYLHRGQSTQLVDSLSGRLDWWELGWAEFLKHPWTGVGAYTSRFEVLAKLGDLETSTIHNSYLEVLLGVGILGLIPLIAALGWTWRQLVRTLRRCRYDSPEGGLALEAVGILSVLFVRSFLSTEFIYHPALCFFLILGYAELLRRRWNNMVHAVQPSMHTTGVY